MPPQPPAEPLHESEIARTIQFFRGRRVILDYDLAAIYGVTTKRLNEQIARNSARFPEDFLFRLTPEETAASMRSQFATASQTRRNARFSPFAFTEHGAIMAATVLNSARAIETSLYVVRAFVKLREVLASNADLAMKLFELETSLDQKLVGQDKAIASILAAIRQLMAPVASPERGAGFTADIEPT
ncbi:MAG TPA: ORF6N domain-containing protein [Steroidobacteraceae bacterium]|nr:ORF6N domain-containing protein [Steroidobacteraceae bacterium]